MEPISETRQAVEEFGSLWPDDGDLLWALQRSAERVRDLVPDCVGFSLASTERGVTFTLMATDDEIAVLDALQYLGGGPCVESVKAEKVLAYNTQEPLDENDWQLFARGTAAAAVASTLTLPILAEGRVVGSVNMYAASGHAFDGRHGALAEIFSAWAPGAVTNADLDFTTRRVAERAPEILRAERHIGIAVGIITADLHTDPEKAREHLREAAQRAGTTEVKLAEKLVEGQVRADQLFDE